MKARSEFWGDNYLAAQQSDSLAVPFEKHMDLFKGKRVLEVGPGEGRQFDAVVNLADEYSVADISAKVLDHYLCAHKFLIKNYDDRFDQQFDLIHFWYVLHHVKRDELNLFFKFLSDHLTRTGSILFNTPQLDPDRNDYGGDGIQTTWLDLEDIQGALDQNFIIMDIENINRNATGWVIWAGKRIKFREV